MALIEERLALLEEEGIGTLWDTHYTAWAYHMNVGNEAEARRWAARAAVGAQVALGRDSADFLKYARLARPP